jgi:hypothetical protein
MILILLLAFFVGYYSGVLSMLLGAWVIADYVFNTSMPHM